MRHTIILFTALGIIASAALAGSQTDNEVLERAHQMQLEFRQGKTVVVQPLVDMLEEATKRSPDNAALWEALGHAYMSKEGTISTSPPDMAALLTTVQYARAAYERSLAIKPDNMLVRASHGMASLVAGQFEGNPAGIAAGVEEMNEAVRRAPKSITVRLTRVFTTIHFPPAMRDNDAVIDDLRFILDNASGGRPDDVLHVLLGDVYAETGKPEAARAEYQQVTGASAFAAGQAALRLDLAKGAIAPAEIAKVREGTGTRCAMCHAAGSDN